MQSDEPAGAQDGGAGHGRARVPPGHAPGSELLGRLSVPSDRKAPRAARAAIADWMPDALPKAVLQNAVLLVSELVANSVEHAGAAAGTPITVSAGTADGVVWFEVADAGRDRVPTRRRPTPASGMGLNMVDAAALRWGTSQDDGTQVWFELAFRAPPGGDRPV